MLAFFPSTVNEWMGVAKTMADLDAIVGGKLSRLKGILSEYKGKVYYLKHLSSREVSF